MKPWLFTSLCFTLLCADTQFLLPHRWHDARHALNHLVKTAKTQIVLIVETLDDRYIERSLRKALEEGRHMLLITPSPALASRWAIYSNVNACVLPDSPLGFSLLIADTKNICSATLPLSEAHFRSRYGLVHCFHHPGDNEVVRLLRQECEPYLQE